MGIPNSRGVGRKRKKIHPVLSHALAKTLYMTGQELYCTRLSGVCGIFGPARDLARPLTEMIQVRPGFGFAVKSTHSPS